MLFISDYPRVVYSDYEKPNAQDLEGIVYTGYEKLGRQAPARLPDRLPADNSPVYASSDFGYSAAFLRSNNYIRNGNGFTTRTPTIIVKIQSQKNNYASEDVYGNRLVL